MFVAAGCPQWETMLKLGTKPKTSWNLQRLDQPPIIIIIIIIIILALSVRKELYSWIDTQTTHWTTGVLTVDDPSIPVVYIQCNLHWKGQKNKEKEQSLAEILDGEAFRTWSPTEGTGGGWKRCELQVKWRHSWSMSVTNIKYVLNVLWDWLVRQWTSNSQYW